MKNVGGMELLIVFVLGVVIGVNMNTQRSRQLEKEKIQLAGDNRVLLDFMGLVVADIERTVDRTAAVLTTSGALFTDLHTKAKSAPVPVVRYERVPDAEKKYGISDLQRACVGEICYVWIDGQWKVLEAEP